MIHLIKSALLAVPLLGLVYTGGVAEAADPQNQPLSVATYNAKFLSACMTKGRQANFLQVAELLKDVDVVALQEVRDRQAAEYYFTPDEWSVIIDDESTDDMNLAFAVRKGVRYRLESGGLINADSTYDFAFQGSNPNFIDERRVLKLNIFTEFGEIVLLNHHAKSRYNGRAFTDQLRMDAALNLIDYIESIGNPNVILLGDFNDTPDDRSLNTLEAGGEQPRTIENEAGAFLVNLSEPLMINEQVSYGLKSNAKTASIIPRVKSSVEGSRSQNIDYFVLDKPVTHALYDQILASPPLLLEYGGQYYSHVFEGLVAVEGNKDTRASDHIPVIVRLGVTEPKIPQLKISSLLPNPAGSDSGKETITLKNLGSDFSGQIILKDASDRTFVQAVELTTNQEKTFTIRSGVTLNNGGDTITLMDQYEKTIDEVSYISSKENIEIHF